MKNKLAKTLSLILAAAVCTGTVAFADVSALPEFPNNGDFATAMKEAITKNQTEEIHAFVDKDYRGVINGTNNVVVTVDETQISELHRELIGVQHDYGGDHYNYYYDSNGELKEQWLEFVKTLDLELPTLRIGGTNATHSNFLYSLGPQEDRIATPAGEVIPGYNITGSAPKQYGMAEIIKVAYSINPDIKFIPCVSVAKMTPEEIENFAHWMLDEKDESEWGRMRAEAGIEEPVKVYTWEMTNEVDYYDRGGQIYVKTTIPCIEAIRRVDPDAHITACGPSAPWGNQITVDKDSPDHWSTWHRLALTQLTPYIDAISWHPYYDGYSCEIMVFFTDKIKREIDQYVQENDIRDKNGNLKDIKIIGTEGARYYSPTAARTYPGGSNYESAISTAHFLNLMFNRDYYIGNSLHNFEGDFQWCFLAYRNGEWYKTPTTKLYEMYLKNLGDRVVKTSWTMDGEGIDTVNNLKEVYDVNKDKETAGYEARTFSVVATPNGTNELVLFVLNKESYKDANITFNFNNDYTLVEETVFSAPNIAAYPYDKYCEGATTVVTTEKNIEHFNSYHMINNSVSVLRLKTNAALSLTEGAQGGDAGEEVASQDSIFEDIQNHWAKNEIALMREQGFVTGVSDTQFAPERDITNAELSAITTKVLGLNTGYKGTFFSDVSDGEWYTGYANALKVEGIVKEDSFRPDSGLTLMELIIFANNIYEKYNGITEVDANAILGEAYADCTAYQRSELALAADRGIIYRLFENGALDISAPATRAEAVSVLYRLTKLVD